MSVKFTERTTGSMVVTSELNALAADSAAVVSTALSNDTTDERNLMADFIVSIAEQASARTAAGTVSLIIVPTVNANTGDYATLATASNYVARLADGTPATFELDAAVTARVLTVSGVQLPNSNYYVGVLNETGQALAATANTIFKSGDYTTDNV